MASKEERSGFPYSNDKVEMASRSYAMGIPLRYIAATLGIKEKTLEMHLSMYPELRQKFDDAKHIAIAKVTKTAYEMAVTGDNPAMTMFYLKTQARWRETNNIEHSVNVKLEDLVAPTFNKEDVIEASKAIQKIDIDKTNEDE